MIEILSSGALNSVQDLGRAEHLRIGVSRGGAMDAVALALANCMVGNPASAAGIEIGLFPFRLRFGQPAWFACTGASTTLTLPHRTAPSWWALQARAGDVLTVAAPELGARAYLALQGGIDVAPVLGSRATDLKSGFGGLAGRGLRKGDRLALGERAAGEGAMRAFGLAPQSRRLLREQLATGTVSVRVLAAAESEHFTPQALAAFHAGAYRLTPDCNRQGFRLAGTGLQTKRPLQLLSHGIVPGTVQVPPDGQPILQLAEANTCGGYPKIATVIEPDLWRVAQLRPGQAIRFESVDYDRAVAAVAAQAQEDARIRQALALRWPAAAPRAA